MTNLVLKGCKIRAWDGPFLPAFYESDRVIEMSFNANAPCFDTGRFAAVELYKLRGPRVHYGLLGASLAPSPTASLQVKVLTSPKNARTRLADTIAKFEEVFVGLPNWFVSCIMGEAQEMITELNFVPAGQLVFECAAHSLGGSSETVFRSLTRTVMSLLLSPEKKDSYLSELCNSRI